MTGAAPGSPAPGGDAAPGLRPSRPRLGVVADDYTGAVDVAATLREAGARVELHLGVPPPDRAWRGGDVAVVGLKTRSVEAGAAAGRSAAAAGWLLGVGASQLFQKYSSTFDSTDAGNIGPVADALCAEVRRRGGSEPAVVLFCPAVPRYGRTVYQGHLFVGDRLVSEAAGDHPLTPRTDADLVRRLARQTRVSVGLLPHQALTGGAEGARATLERLAASGVRYVVADAVDDADLAVLGEVARAHPLVTGAAGLATALLAGVLPGPAAPATSAVHRGHRSGAPPGEHLPAEHLPAEHLSAEYPPPDLPGALLAGSCTAETLEQVRRFEARWPVLRFRPSEVAAGRDVLAEARRLAADHLGGGPVGVVASAPPDVVRTEQQALGRDRAAELVERTLGEVAEALVALGVRRLVTAGGETSGAVVERCRITHGTVGAAEAPGVAWLRVGDVVPAEGAPAEATPEDGTLWVLLKSGPLGDADVLVRALAPAA
ncbi:four-carbon acid sugar kinase family protein [Georgenia daeguensis]|uniref:Four-carbon acid sugar kinase family protein n=1 Tax=Georgenia daeguensis TaxID=908355 RepID=A0ABP8EVR6_9MICO